MSGLSSDEKEKFKEEEGIGMDNSMAIHYQDRITRLTHEWNSTQSVSRCNAIETALEQATLMFELELSKLPPQLKELSENGYLIPNSRKTLIKSLLK